MQITDKRGASLDVRFWMRVKRSLGGGCWEWLGSKTDRGYGRIKHHGRELRAHALSYEINVGRVGRMIVCHSCDNPGCVRPDHLWLGTHTENIADRDRKGRTARGEQISNTCKLNEQTVRAIRKLWRTEGTRLKPGHRGGLNFSEVGRRFGISNVQARNICLGKSWKHVAVS